MSKPNTNILDALLGVARGAAHSAAWYQMSSKSAEKEQMARRDATAGCTPCKAQAYVDGLKALSKPGG